MACYLKRFSRLVLSVVFKPLAVCVWSRRMGDRANGVESYAVKSLFDWKRPLEFYLTFLVVKGRLGDVMIDD